MYRRTLALTIVPFGLTVSGRAAELDDAVAAAHRGEYAVAFRLTYPLAENGDARAQFNIGYMYANGWGVQRDLAGAVNWYRKAAEQGLEVAQHHLGIAYINGDGIERDDAEAAKWFKRAAEQGFPGRNSCSVVCTWREEAFRKTWCRAMHGSCWREGEAYPRACLNP